MENNSIKQAVLMKAQAAKEAQELCFMTSQQNNMLAAMADALQNNAKEIIYNEIDVEAAKESGLSAPLLTDLFNENVYMI